MEFSLEDKANIEKILKAMYLALEPKNRRQDLAIQNELFIIDTARGTDGIAGDYLGLFDFACFTGSNEGLDWIINCNKRAGADGLHDGFKAAADFVLHRLTEKLDTDVKNFLGKTALDFQNSQKKLYLGGYSNGGAIALLVADYYASLGFPVVLATWGQPKVCSPRGTLITGTQIEKYYRFVHPFDPVPYVPLRLAHTDSINIRCRGWHRFPHSFNLYAENTAELIATEND